VWTTFNTANSALPDDFVRSLGAIPGGGIWAGTTGGLVKFRNGVMQAYDFLSQGSESNNVASIAAVDTNIVWLGMVNGGLIRLSDTGFVDYTIYNSSLMDNTILGLKRENQDLWLATPANGLIYYWNLAFIAYHPFNSASPSASYNALDLDQAGGIWLASQDSGLVYYDRSIWLNFNTLNSPFPQNYVRTVAYDPVQDVVWAGTHSQGLVRVQRTGALGSVGPENSVDWSFYPQPATDHIWLRKSSPEQKEWVLMDLGGRPLDGGIWIDQELEVRVGNHPAGLYILQVDQEFRKVLIRP